MLSIFTRRKNETITPVTTDIHSHLLAGLDDGVRSLEEAIEVLGHFREAGFRKVITTPHVMSDYYKNTPQGIGDGLTKLKQHLEGKLDIEIEAAAEYYLDENLLVQAGNPGLLTFGNRYLLFETNFVSEPFHLKEFIFKATSSGYRPVLAHPERYQYMSLKKAEDLRDRGVLLQINTLSLIGYYSAQVQKMAQQLVDQKWVDMVGSDCHNAQHAELLPSAWRSKYYQKALALPLLNHTI